MVELVGVRGCHLAAHRALQLVLDAVARWLLALCLLAQAVAKLRDGGLEGHVRASDDASFCKSYSSSVVRADVATPALRDVEDHHAAVASGLQNAEEAVAGWTVAGAECTQYGTLARWQQCGLDFLLVEGKQRE